MTATFPDALGPLVQQIEAHVYNNPPRAIDAARQLLKQCTKPVQIAYVYEQLGFAHLILGEHRLSCLFYEEARAFDPHNMYVLANLAHAQYELGEHARARISGATALRLKDEDACKHAAASIAALEPRYQGAQHIIAFSLYGDKPRYCEMAVLNVLAARRHLPEFVCRFYVDASTPAAMLERLQALGAQCIAITGQAQQLPPTFWRFLAMDDVQADCVLVRDVDALIDAREAWCVHAWRESGMPFHIIRDDCCHTELILAGLLGIRAGVVRDMAARMEAFAHTAGAAAGNRYGDQLFLRNVVWPQVRAHSLTHDRIYAYGPQVQPVAYTAIANEGPRNIFTGANYATCEMACTLDTPAPGVLPFVTIKNSAGTLICRYSMQRDRSAADPRRWSIHLPQSYRAQLESGQWHYDVALLASGQARHGEGSTDAAVLGFA